MSRTFVLPKVEAKVTARALGSDAPAHDVLDIDPIMLPTEPYPAGAAPYVADVFDGALVGLMDGICALDSGTDEYTLVWSDSGFAVKGVCPMCDDVFVVSEGWPVTVEIRDGIGTCAAVGCGCADRDN